MQILIGNVTVLAKMCRGAMTGFIIRNRIKDLAAIKTFSEDGFAYHGDGKNELKPVFIKD